MVDISSRTIKQLNIAYYSLLSVMIIAAVVAWYFVSFDALIVDFSAQAQMNLKAFIVIIALAGIPVNIKFHQRKIQHILTTISVKEKKVEQYKIAMFVKYATLEALAFIALFGYLLSSDISLLLISCIMIVAFAINYPNKEKMYAELQFDTEDDSEFTIE